MPSAFYNFRPFEVTLEFNQEVADHLYTGIYGAYMTFIQDPGVPYITLNSPIPETRVHGRFVTFRTKAELILNDLFGDLNSTNTTVAYFEQQWENLSPSIGYVGTLSIGISDISYTASKRTRTNSIGTIHDPSCPNI